MATQSFKVSIVGEGLNIVREVDKDLADRVAVLLLGGSAPPSGSGSGEKDTKHGQTTSPLKVGEFLASHGAKRNIEKIAAIAQFCKEHLKKDVVTLQEINQQFEAANEKPPAYMSRDIKWALGAKLIAPKTGADDTYYITNAGTQAVHANFPADVRKRTKVNKGKKQKKKGASQ